MEKSCENCEYNIIGCETMCIYCDKEFSNHEYKSIIDNKSELDDEGSSDCFCGYY